MKEQLTLNDLCGYLPYGLNIVIAEKDGYYCPYPFIKKYGHSFVLDFINEKNIWSNRAGDNWLDTLLKGKYYKPIFRNLATDLTREIEHNGEKFVPALKLAELMVERGLYKDIAPSIDFKYAIIQKPFGKMLKVTKCEDWVIMLSLKEIDRAKHLIVQQLQQWHFWLGDQSFFEKGIILDYNDVNGL